MSIIHILLNIKSTMKIQGLGKYVHMKRLCSPEGHFNMLALDQRPPIFNIIEKIKNMIKNNIINNSNYLKYNPEDINNLLFKFFF